jgi:hypothetical protein
MARSATGTVDGRAARRRLEWLVTMFFCFLPVRLLQTRLDGEVGEEVGRGSSGSGTLLKMALQKSWMPSTSLSSEDLSARAWGFWPAVPRAGTGLSTEEQGASLLPSGEKRG